MWHHGSRWRLGYLGYLDPKRGLCCQFAGRECRPQSWWQNKKFLFMHRIKQYVHFDVQFVVLFWFSFWHIGLFPLPPGSIHFLWFLGHTQWHTTVGRTSLDEWSACCRDLCLTPHNVKKRWASMPPAGFEPTIPASTQPQTLALDCSVKGIGTY